MKTIFNLIAVLLLITISSCNKSYFDETINQEQFRKSIQEEKLDNKFNLNSNVYNEFINSIIFDENGKLIGAKYDGIEKELNDKESNKFWNHFGLSIRNAESNNLKSADVVVYEGYKPRRGGCKANSNWICVIRADQ